MYYNYKEIRERAYQSAQEVPIEDIVQRYYNGPTHKSGATVFINCPNPDCPSRDKSVPDHCAISYKKNLFHCFSCDAKGGSLGLYSLLTGKEFKESILDLGLLAGGISADEYSEVSDNSNIVTERRTRKIQGKIQEPEKEYKLAPAEMIDLVYREMLGLKEFQLTSNLCKYLITERKLMTKEQKEYMFFCYHEKFSTEELVERIKRKFPAFRPELLAGVPGFYFKYNPKNKKIGWWNFVYPSTEETLGLAITNEKGQVVGLQQRVIEKKGGSKYYWISSGNMNDKKKGIAYGVSSGSPVNVIFPSENTNNLVTITEGKFKGISLTQSMSSISLSVQGVSNVKKIPDIIKYLGENKKIDESTSIVLAFDADIYFNRSVFRNLKTLCEDLSHTPYSVKVLTWKKEYGKGFDDLRNNNADFKDHLMVVSAEFFIMLYENLSNKILSTYFQNARIEDVDKNETLKNQFDNILYRSMFQ